MKNAASCETWCELQDTLSTYSLNAHCGLGPSRGFVCVRVGSYIKRGEFVFYLVLTVSDRGQHAFLCFLALRLLLFFGASTEGANARVVRCTRALTRSPPPTWFYRTLHGKRKLDGDWLWKSRNLSHVERRFVTSVRWNAEIETVSFDRFCFLLAWMLFEA